MNNLNKKYPIIYNDCLLNKSKILEDNKDKSGIYRWINIYNNLSYVGRSKNLYARFNNYYSKKYLENELLKYNSLIYRALLIYGYNNFNLEILEYCDIELTIEREKHYINLLNPEYNIQLNKNKIKYYFC